MQPNEKEPWNERSQLSSEEYQKSSNLRAVLPFYGQGKDESQDEGVVRHLLDLQMPSSSNNLQISALMPAFLLVEYVQTPPQSIAETPKQAAKWPFLLHFLESKIFRIMIFSEV